MNRIYETQNLLSLQLVSFLVGLKTYQHPGNVTPAQDIVRSYGSQLIPFPLCLFRIYLKIILTSTPRNTRVGTLIAATIYLQLIQNRYMFRSFTVLHSSHQHCVQPVTSDVEVVGYL